MGDFAMVGLAALTFIATNIDGGFLLIGFMAHPACRVRDVVLGQFLGSTAMTLLCVLVAKAGMAIPYAHYFGLLGLLQVVIGLRRLHDGQPTLDEAICSPTAGWVGGEVLTVAVTTISGCADNFSVYVPLFATAGVGGIGACVTVFALMTGLWCLAAHWLVSRHVLRARLQLTSRLVLPWLLIALGIVITVGALLNRIENPS